MKLAADRNTTAQAAGVVLVIIGVLLSAAGRSDSGLSLAGVLLLVLGLIGLDRIRSLKAFGGELNLDEIKQTAEEQVKSPPSMAIAQDRAAVTRDKTLAGALTFEGRLTAQHVGAPTPDSVIAGIRSASTPGEVLDQVAGYAALRSAPGLRGLSEDRIRLEQDLYGAILRLQTRRHDQASPADPEAFANVLQDIERFWSGPELLSDEAIANLTARIAGVISTMNG